MDEQQKDEENDDTLTERSAAAEEDEQIDNRSIAGDLELDIPSYFCHTCK